MIPEHAVELYQHAERLHDHIRSAPLSERVEARRHIRKFVADAKQKRDAAIAAAEAKLPPLRAVTEAARLALAGARATENRPIDKVEAEARRAIAAAEAAEQGPIREINAAQSEFAVAKLLEHRLEEFPDRAADDALASEAAADAASAATV